MLMIIVTIVRTAAGMIMIMTTTLPVRLALAGRRIRSLIMNFSRSLVGSILRAL